MASNPYSIAQDVASAIRLFLGELYYDTSKGMPYFEQILGQTNSEAIIKAQTELAALTVPEVVQAQCTALYFDPNKPRGLTGTIEIIDLAGTAQSINF